MDRVCKIHMPIHVVKTIKRLVSLRSVVKTICNVSNMTLDLFDVSFMDSPAPWFINIRIPLKMAFWKTVAQGIGIHRVSESLIADNIIYNIVNQVVIHGIPKVENFVTDEITINTPTGKVKRWSVTTLGSDLRHVLRLPQVDSRRTISNDVTEMCDVLGMHAARKSLENEFLFVMSGMADARHIKLIARMMASDLVIKGMKIRQVAQNIPPLQRAAYEQGPKQMVEYCALAEQDDGQTICGAVFMNKIMAVGTGYNLELRHRPEVKVPDRLLAHHQARPTRICQYVFSPKVDGVRYFLVFFHNRQKDKIVALVDRKFEVFLLSNENLPDAYFSGTILDGELTKLSDGKYAFLTFDCLMSCGNKSSVLRYDQRIEVAREVLFQMAVVQSETLEVVTGLPFQMGHQEPYALPISRRPEMSNCLFQVGKLPFRFVVKPLFDLKGLMHYTQHWIENLPFGVDGYVITNLYEPCYPFRMRREAIFKWKPRNEVYSENTVDFILTPRHDQVEALATKFSTHPRAKNRWSSDVPMHTVEGFRKHEGDCSLWTVMPDRKRFKFSDGTMALPQGEEPQKDKVYECRWNYKDQRWEVVRFRNKDVNQWATVVATIQNIVEDIQLQELVIKE